MGFSFYFFDLLRTKIGFRQIQGAGIRRAFLHDDGIRNKDISACAKFIHFDQIMDRGDQKGHSKKSTRHSNEQLFSVLISKKQFVQHDSEI